MPAKLPAVLVISIGVALLFFSMLYPPWLAYTRNPYGGMTQLPCGYGFLFTQPAPSSPNVSIKIDFVGLFVEWSVILGGSVACLLLGRRRVPKAPKGDAEKTSPPGTAEISQPQSPDGRGK